ncbi:unnamed protein product [Closterium sp. NIES-53]
MATAGAAAPSASLYVGDLDKEVTEAQLYELFSQVGPVASIRVCRDAVTRRSLGYAYVNYNSAVDGPSASCGPTAFLPSHFPPHSPLPPLLGPTAFPSPLFPPPAERAMEALNYREVNGRPIRIMWSHRDPSHRRSGVGNIFIKNLDESIDHKALHDTFSAFGPIWSCKIAVTPEGKSKGYGFVHFETEEAANLAIEKVNGMLVEGKKVFVGKFLKRGERDSDGQQARFTNVFVRNLAPDVTEEQLSARFSEIGPITNAVVMRDDAGASKGFGFVNFQDPASAQEAVEKLNNAQFGLPPPSDVTEEQLDARFLEIGPITNAVVMRVESGVSKGFGFVNFQDPASAQEAVEKLNDAQFGASSLFAWSGPGFAGVERVLRHLTTCYDGGVSKGFGFVNFQDPASAQEAVEKLNNAQFGTYHLK